MRVHISAIGRMKNGPEADLVRDYTERFVRSGKGIGFSALKLHENEARSSDMASEMPLLLRPIPENATLITMDERGELMSSRDFAFRLSEYRDDGLGDLAFIIGGADGIHPALRAQAHFSISLGKMVWPHKLVRVMLTEQLYRAVSILTGAPYHRD